MIVISDSSALSALAEADLLSLLPRLCGVVTIPEAVRGACVRPRAPQPLRDWIRQPLDEKRGRRIAKAPGLAMTGIKAVGRKLRP